MTVIRPNSITGINSITVQSGQALNVHDASGNLIRSLTNESGISTFSGINIGTAATIKANGNATFSGIVTASSFVGDGSGLTGAGPTLTGSTNNTIVTVTGANAIQGETKLTFDGGALSQTIDANDEGINITSSGAHSARFKVDTNQSSADDTIFFQSARWNSTEVASIHFRTGADTTNKDDGRISFHTRPSGGSMAERLRITEGGLVGIGTASPEEILHVKAASETVSSRDGVIFGSTDSLAADKGLPLVWASHIGTDANYGVASICGRKENATSDNGAGYLQFATGSAAGAISEKLRIDSNGDLLHSSPDRNYASWYKSPSNSHSNSASSSTEDLIFGTAVIANTDVYDTSNGRYTAPVDGLYHIRFNGLIDNNAGDAGMQILMRKNGSNYGAQIAYQTISSKNSGIYNQMSGTGIMYMSAGDYATIYASAGMHTSNECNYIVYLIRGETS